MSRYSTEEKEPSPAETKYVALILLKIKKKFSVVTVDLLYSNNVKTNGLVWIRI